MKKFATYIRVSTQKQGRTGLGLDAQRKMCDEFIKRNGGEHAQEFMDVESGTHRERRGLWQAIEYCKKNGCGLVIAKLDRLARDVEFTFKVINTGIDIHFTDMPVVNSMILGVFAAVAQYERELVSSRTKAALSVKKSQGIKLGAASVNYQLKYKLKSQEERKEIEMKRGECKRLRFQENKETKAFVRILRNVFPDATNDENPAKWDWKMINCKQANKVRMLNLMKDYNEMDCELFRKWDFDCDFYENNATATKLRGKVDTFKKSFLYN